MSNSVIDFDLDTTEFDKAIRLLEPKELKKVSDKATRSASAFLVRNAKKALKSAVGTKVYSSVGRYNKKSGKKLKLFQGIKYGRFKKDFGIRKVHILGEYRLKWFEKGTKERYQKTVNGKTLKKARRLGKMTGKRFFDTTINRDGNQTKQILRDTFQSEVYKIFNK